MLREWIEELVAREPAKFKWKDRAVFNDFKKALNRGLVRAAERDESGNWRVNSWVKQGILLGFRMGEIADMSPSDTSFVFFDKNTYPVRATRL